MGSRLRENVQRLFECFCEVAQPVGEKQAWMLQKYPDSFSDEEILKSVPKFAYPCEIENLSVQHFSFVLTSIDSKWTFGFCRHDPKTETALVVLSALPWHETFYNFLNHIASLMSKAKGEGLWKFLGDVYNAMVPMQGGSISVPLPDSNVSFVCQSPKQFQLPSIPENRNLTEYYSAVDAHNMMMIFASMLYERRIIFTSKRLSRLSACVQACNALIYPMIWQHIFIPVLPLCLMDYLLAPMPFLIGVPAPTLQRVQKADLGEVVILDADNNAIESPFEDLESLPQDVVTSLRKALRNRATLLGDGVSRAFLRALVQLTAGYREALTLQQGERITFDRNAFVESRPVSMQPFLKKMLELQIFQQFIEERLNMLNSGLGFSDEFEMEACSYSVKSSGKLMQQYRDWTYTMKRESTAFFRSVKDKANPAVKYAVKSVKDRGKDVKTAYKGLRWKGRSSRHEMGMRFHQPRSAPSSAPSSPTMERKSIGSTSSPKSSDGFTAVAAAATAAATTYRKETRLRNSNFSESRKQYSPLSPASPEDSESPPERLNIDLMQELRDVIFPSTTPPVNRTLKPVRSLDSLRPAWTGRLRHGPPPSTVVTHPRESSSAEKTLLVSASTSPHDPSSFRASHDSSGKSPGLIAQKDTGAWPTVGNTTMRPLLSQNSARDRVNVPTVNPSRNVQPPSRCSTDGEGRRPILKLRSKLDDNSDVKSSSDNRRFRVWRAETLYREATNKPCTLSNNVSVDDRDPFDTSNVLGGPPCLQTRFLHPTHVSLAAQARGAALHPPNTATSCSASVKETMEMPDLIRLDSTNSTDDFDPLLSKSSEFSDSKQMTQSLHIPDMGEGLSNPLYPYFQPVRVSSNADGHHSPFKKPPSDSIGDLDLLQAYGLDFHKFSIANGRDRPPTGGGCVARDQEISAAGINNTDNAFDLPLNTSVVKSQDNWMKFE